MLLSFGYLLKNLFFMFTFGVKFSFRSGVVTRGLERFEC